MTFGNDEYAQRKMSAIVDFPVHQPFLWIHKLLFHLQIPATGHPNRLLDESEDVLRRCRIQQIMQ